MGGGCWRCIFRSSGHHGGNDMGGGWGLILLGVGWGLGEKVMKKNGP